MRALQTDQHGGLRLAEVEPEPLPDDAVRIKVTAAGINPVDTYVRAGYALEQGWAPDEPQGLGWDVAGTVTEVGPGVADPSLRQGIRVAGLVPGAVKERGGQSTEIVAAAADVAALPDALDDVAAASVPLNSLTADQALALLDDLDAPDRTLLVTGAAGGVGGYAVPLAVQRGWNVVGLARESDREYVESVGGRLVTSLDGVEVDAALDAGNLRARARDVVRPRGWLVEVVTGTTEPSDAVEVRSVRVQPDGVRLAQLLAATADGSLPARVRETYPLAEFDRAYDAFGQGGRGRVVLLP